MCTENIEWAKNENRTFLRQALEVISIFLFISIYDMFFLIFFFTQITKVRLIGLYFEKARYTEALSLGKTKTKKEN